jgi:hypothetical protein
MGAAAEPLSDIARLVTEVNNLTDEYGLTSELDLRRLRAAGTLAQVIPIGQVAV